jgi:hypothetical protein
MWRRSHHTYDMVRRLTGTIEQDGASEEWLRVLSNRGRIDFSGRNERFRSVALISPTGGPMAEGYYLSHGTANVIEYRTFAGRYAFGWNRSADSHSGAVSSLANIQYRRHEYDAWEVWIPYWLLCCVIAMIFARS